MSRPDDDNRSAGSTAHAWDDDSEETRVVRPPAGGYYQDRPSGSAPAGAEPGYPASAEAIYRAPAEPGYSSPAEPGYRAYADPVERSDPFSAPAPEVSSPPVGSPIAGSSATGEPAAWSPSYSDQPVYPAQTAVTSVYPQTSPGYAPTGYPAAYAPAVVVPPPAPATLPEQTSSRVGPGFLCGLIGLLLTAGGVWLLVKYGTAVKGNVEQGRLVIKDSTRTALGAVLLLAAVVLNGWSPWSTIVPGIALTGVGGWALFDVSAPARAAGWTKSVLPELQTTAWHSAGFTLVIGLVLLAASAAAIIARAAGKRDGRILGRRQA